MKKTVLLGFIVTFATNVEATIIPLIKIGVGTISLGASYKAAQAANACGEVAANIAKEENPGAVTLATLPAMGSVGFWGCSIFSGAFGAFLLYQGIQALIKK